MTFILKATYNIIELTVSIWLERLRCCTPFGARPSKCALDPHKIIPKELIKLRVKGQLAFQYGYISAVWRPNPLSCKPA